jgi:Ca-activated chloride channel homolog
MAACPADRARKVCRRGPSLLDDLTEVTGGRTFTVSNPNDMADVVAKIGIALRDEYVLAYQPLTNRMTGNGIR